MADGLTVQTRGIELRPARDEDRAFLLEVYAASRADELSVVPWTDAEKASFIKMQFEAQDAYYRETYPGARFLVVTRDGVPIGRLYLAALEDEIRIIDIALLPDHRGAGIGTGLIAEVMAEADAAGLAVRLHVEPWNPARQLYERFGFRTVRSGGVYDLMEHPTRTPQLNMAS